MGGRTTATATQVRQMKSVLPSITPAMACRCTGCIDRILPKNLMRHHPNVESYSGRVRAISPIGRSWLNGSKLQVRFIGGTEAQRAVVREQAGWWTAHANIVFEFNQSPQADIRISFNPADGAWSYIGTDCKSIPSDQPTMNLAFLDGGTAAHEIGHALGLSHEHQSPAGGIQWNKEVVLRDLAGAPNFWDSATVFHNIFSKYEASQINGTIFDSLSVMLYSFPASWTLNGFSSKPNNILSVLDRSFIASERMYPHNKPTTADATELLVDAPLRTKGAIGEYGEVDLFRFEVKTAGRYLMDTFGFTDVVMDCYGPNSETALIASDDDSGAYLNSKINIDLVPGTYFLSVRHYNKIKGTGAYSVRVATV